MEEGFLPFLLEISVNCADLKEKKKRGYVKESLTWTWGGRGRGSGGAAASLESGKWWLWDSSMDDYDSLFIGFVATKTPLHNV